MDLFTIATYALIFAAGAFLGVLLGRRSSGANKAVDRIQAEYDELHEAYQRQAEKLKEKLKK